MIPGTEEVVPRAKPATVDVILEVAVDMFSSSGYDGSSMRDIAARVGVRPASIYNYFSSKDELLWAIIESTMTDLLDRQRAAIGDGTPHEQLTRFVVTHVEFHAFERKRALVVNGRIASLDQANHRKIHRMRHEYEQLLTEIIEKGIADGTFNPFDERLATYAVLQMGVAVSGWYREDGVLPIEYICDAYVAMALQCLGARS